MDMSVIISKLGELFLLMAVGFAASKARVLSAEADKLISKIMINITMPCTILNSVIGGNIDMSGGDVAYFLLMIMLALLLALLFAVPLSRIPPLRSNKADTGLYAYMIAFGNVGFIGFPVTNSIFGEASAFYVALINIPFTILIFSVGIALISGKGGKIDPKQMINPALIAGAAAVLIFALSLEAPAMVQNTVKMIGDMTTPCAMLIIGSTLAKLPAREVFSEWRMYIVAFERLVVIPFLIWLILRNIVSDSLMLGVIVIIAGMPVASTAAMLSMEYGGNEAHASKGIFLTTVLSIATIPLVVLLLGV